MAGKKNLSKVLNIPADIAVSDMNNKYGKVISSIVLANIYLESDSVKPGAKIDIIVSEKVIPRSTIINNITARLPWTKLINFFNSIGFLTLYSLRTGTKDWINAPSAKSLLKKLGILNAMKKASVLFDAPKIFAKIISLIKPDIREINVMPPTMYDDFTREFLWSCIIFI